MEILAIFNKEKVTAEELNSFKERRATRGVVFDKNNNVGLLYAGDPGYYGLPGGGVDEKETYEQGVARECKEEIGCDIDIEGYIGTTLEYIKNSKIINETWSYSAHVIGEKGKRIFVETDTEIDRSTIVVWVSLDEAIRLMKVNARQANLYSQYYVERDLLILEKAKETLNKSQTVTTS